MKVTHQEFQATDLSPAPGATVGTTPGAAAAGPARAPARAAAEAARGEHPRRVGVVFVHGIGDQKPAETFLDWSEAIVRMLSAWRAEQGFGLDPVVRSQFAFNPGALPFLELAIPAFGDREASRWVVTEALWAEAIRPPKLDVVAAYLRDRLWTIVAGIQSGYRMREPKWVERKKATALVAQSVHEPWIEDRLAELGRPGWGWIGMIDRLQRSFLTQWLVVLPVVALGTLLLAIWAPLRRVPIGPLRDLAEAQLVDSFLTNWFGDLPVLLKDPVQSANVRARTAEAIRALTAQGCDSIVVVAHSGGAIVSFETLLDRVYLNDPERAITVDKLVTHGEGLKLAWRLEDAYDRNLQRGNRLSGDLGAARPDLHWVDVWASFDPAPAGPLEPPHGVEFDVAATGEPGRTARESGTGRLTVESRPVTNLMSLRGDHGAYWDNDEGYLVPLLRHIDDPRGWGEGSRFYELRELRTVRIERRRQRVAVLAAWRWIVAVAALAAIVLGGWLAGAPRVAGDTLIGTWNRIPGGEIVSAPLNAVWGAIGTLLSAVGLGVTAADLPAVGRVILGIVAIGLLFGALGRIGGWAWSRWDARERAASRLERLPALDRGFALAAGVTLVAAVAGLLAATLVAGTGGRVAIVLAVSLVVGAAVSAIVAAGVLRADSTNRGAGREPHPASRPPSPPPAQPRASESPAPTPSLAAAAPPPERPPAAPGRPPAATAAPPAATAAPPARTAAPAPPAAPPAKEAPASAPTTRPARRASPRKASPAPPDGRPDLRPRTGRGRPTSKSDGSP